MTRLPCGSLRPHETHDWPKPAHTYTCPGHQPPAARAGCSRARSDEAHPSTSTGSHTSTPQNGSQTDSDVSALASVGRVAREAAGEPVDLAAAVAQQAAQLEPAP